MFSWFIIHKERERERENVCKQNIDFSISEIYKNKYT